MHIHTLQNVGFQKHSESKTCPGVSTLPFKQESGVKVWAARHVPSLAVLQQNVKVT